MKIGIIGQRGLSNVAGIRTVSGVEVTGFADLSSQAREKAKVEFSIPNVFETLEELLPTVEAVIIATPMHLHASMSIQALMLDKHVMCEVTAGMNFNELNALYAAAKESKGSYTFAENYGYVEANQIALAAAKAKMFGEIYFGEGHYVHEVRFLHHHADGTPTWRNKDQVGVRGNTYITHEIGPLMEMLRAADPTVQIESVTCFGTGVHTVPNSIHDDTSLTVVKLSNGGILNLRLDMVSNRPGRTYFELQGVLGCYELRNDKGHMWIGENESLGFYHHREWRPIDEFKGLLSEELVAEIEAAKASGHGGADYFVGRRFAQSLVDGTAPQIGIEEGCEWTAVGLMSQISLANGSIPIEFKDLWDPGRSRAQLRMHRENLDGLPEIALPSQFTLAEYQPEDLESLAETLNFAFLPLSWDSGKVQREILDDKSVFATMVIKDEKGVVAVANCRHLSEDPGVGYVHWVAVHPRAQGHQLGLQVSLACLSRFSAEGKTSSILDTDDFRVAAIKTYLRLGFNPLVTSSDHAARWQAVKAQIKMGII